MLMSTSPFSFLLLTFSYRFGNPKGIGLPIVDDMASFPFQHSTIRFIRVASSPEREREREMIVIKVFVLGGGELKKLFPAVGQTVWGCPQVRG